MAFAMLVSDTLGNPAGKISYVQSSTFSRGAPRGGGTIVLKSPAGGSAVSGRHRRAGSRPAVAGPRRCAEAAVDDIELTEDGRFGVAGVPSAAVTWAQAAAAAQEVGRSCRRPDVAQGATFPFGAHVSVVEVDTETGR
ncbi:molybdopterin-dependent oxidoreductase [Pseudonocardia sp. MCCB 268]|nr:molybdopterin-dependent oxidoreductase [Pseudonocardia cytotoxica]